MKNKKTCEETVDAISVSTKVVDDDRIRQTVKITFKSGRSFKKAEIHYKDSSIWYEDMDVGNVVRVTYGSNNTITKIIRLHA